MKKIVSILVVAICSVFANESVKNESKEEISKKDKQKNSVRKKLIDMRNI